MTSASRGVLFDISASGARLGVSWTAARTDDSWLAPDRNGNGRIDNGAELFGNVTPQPAPTGEETRNGFLALAVYDTNEAGGNGDGWIDRNDAEFAHLLLWCDRNHNGISETPELLPVARSPITAMSLQYKESRWVDIYGNQFRYKARIARSGRSAGQPNWAYDIFLVLAERPSSWMSGGAIVAASNTH